MLAGGCALPPGVGRELEDDVSSLLEPPVVESPNVVLTGFRPRTSHSATPTAAITTTPATISATRALFFFRGGCPPGPPGCPYSPGGPYGNCQYPGWPYGGWPYGGWPY